ncbi:MAG TPA: hypothetical protein DCS97_06760 [Planctomycetes bacterium]|nr:hypothetical protein [Planctomycetota bacterium]
MSTTPNTSTTALSVSTPAWTAGIYGQLEAAKPVAEMLAKSELVPKGFQNKPNDILIAGAMGARLGLDLFSSLAGIAVVNGRATLWGDALMAVCMNHPAFEDCIEEVVGKPYEDDFAAVCTVKRKGRAPKTVRFSVIEAKEASLWKKAGPWTNTPQRMLTLRARAFALRGAFADALAGFNSREEMEDTEPREVEATVHAEPKPAKRRTVEATADAVIAAAKVETEPAPADHPEAPLPETKAEPAPVKDTSVPACQAAFGKLWKFSEDGKKSAVEILKLWKIERVAELEASDDEDRAEFLLAVSNASVRIGVAQ